MSTLNRKEILRKKHRRIRRKISGTAARPRLAVHCSNKNIYLQAIDDEAGRTLFAVSSLGSEVENGSANVTTAEKIGALAASKAKDMKIETVLFDRGGHLYHGKIKALADAAREAGLKL